MKIKNTWKRKIYYSQCWEDPALLSEALHVGPSDSVLSITSGGDNTFALALQNPQKIVAIDINPAQNFLFELKIVAIKQFDYESFLAFIGVIDSSDRIMNYERIKNLMSSSAQEWWNENLALVEEGIIHCGVFEKYLRIFRKIIVPLIHSKKKIDKLFRLTSLEEQKRFYDAEWNTWRWRILFRMFSSKFVLSRLGRNAALFEHAGIHDIGAHYLAKIGYALTAIPIRDNYFLEYIFKGTYRVEGALPPYLRKENFKVLKEGVSRIEIVSAEMKDYIANQQENYFSCFNLSNIFEVYTLEQTEEIFREFSRVGRGGARIAYWNNLVKRSLPISSKKLIREETELEKKLYKADRVFFYASFNVNSIIK